MFETAIVFAAKYLIYIEMLAFVAFLCMARRRVRARLALITIITLPLAYITAKIASYFWYHTRPFVEAGIAPLIDHAADNGFPSDHMLLASTLASIVMLRYPRIAVPFWLMAVAIGTARILAHVHHVTDIAASAAIGMASAFFAFYIVVLRRMRQTELSQPQ
jgi:undecaprenyl-diphosphatase